MIGIDDWAWCKEQRYGTLICDLERRQVIDLLPEREPATVEAWLRAHPDIRVVARDRLREDGFCGSLRVIGEWATRQRRAEQALPNGTGKAPPARRIAQLLGMGRDHLSEAALGFM